MARAKPAARNRRARLFAANRQANPGAAERLAAADARGRLPRNQLARRIRWARQDRGRSRDLQRRDGAGQGPGAAQSARALDGRSDHPRARHRSAEETLRAQDPLLRGDLVSGLFGGRLRLRRRRAQDSRRTQGRRIHRQWIEGVDLARPRRRLVHAAGAHRSFRAQASRHLLPAGRHEDMSACFQYRRTTFLNLRT